jgi:tetratricopeptide (TPR) repeat protein
MELMATAEELYNEAEKLKDAGQLEAAIAKLDQALEITPSHVLSHLTLAVLCGKVSKHEQAVKHAEQACQLDPSDAFNFTALSVTYQRAYAGTGNTAYIRMAEDARDRAHALQGRHQH